MRKLEELSWEEFRELPEVTEEKKQGYATDEEKKTKADFVINWYDRWLETHSELEKDLLKEINVESLEGRFEVIMLGTLFNAWGMREERAFRLWKSVRQWFKKRDYNYLEVLSGKDSARLKEFKKDALSIGLPPTFIENMKTTIHNLSMNYEGDLNNLIVINDWKKTIKRIQDTCQGIYQKAFWIARVMKQKGAWDVPDEFCCVSDSHVKAFLKKTGFIHDTSDLFYNSRVLWEYFNQGRLKMNYDLPVFRFARERRQQCKNCSTQQCNLDNMIKCVNKDNLSEI